MPDEGRSIPKKPVEPYKITPDTVAFVKNFKKVRRVGEMLQNALEIQLAEADVIRNMLREASTAQQQLLSNPPELPTFELTEQDAENFNVTF